jgi:hypothetical protein
VTTHVTYTHTVELPQRLIEGDEDNDFVMTFSRTAVQLQALQALARMYPCITQTDGLEATVTMRQEKDVFSRLSVIGTATSPCGTPGTCPATPKARP